MRKYRLNIMVAFALLASAWAQADTLALSSSECVQMALRHSEAVHRGGNAMLQADLDGKVAATAALPKFDGSATALATLPDMDMGGQTMQMRGAYVAGIQLVQPIYAGGKITAGKKLAAIGKEAAARQLELTQADVMAETANAYWTYVAVRAKVALTVSYLEMMDTLFAQTQTAVEAGMATPNELLRITAKRSEVEYQHRKAQNGANLCRLALANLIGVEQSTLIEPVDSMPRCVEPADLQADVASRPEVQLLELQVRAAEEQVKLTRGDFLPTVGLSVGYNYYGNIKVKGVADLGGGTFMPYTREVRDGIAMGVLSVSIPLFHWGEGRAKIRKAQYEVDNARLDLQRNRNLLNLELEQARTNLTDGLGLVRSSALSLEQATENLRVMRNRYTEGMATLTDLLDAQSQWHQASANRIEALTQFQIYHTAWLKASGQLAP